MMPLVEDLGVTPIYFDSFWQELGARSWTLSHWARRVGCAYYGSDWNSLCPIRDERRLAGQVPPGTDIVHFVWGEFASPVQAWRFRKRARALIGTFHASASRQPVVLKRFRALSSYDYITVMSQTQVNFFVQRGMPSERIRVILHGVDTGYFAPAPRRETRSGDPIRGLLVGKTERDHAFMAEVLRRIPRGVLRMTVLTAPEQRANYTEVPGTEFPDSLSDSELLRAYQQADLLIMPMLDCAANNAILEAMACGTPVLSNRVGGIPEYVCADCNYLMADKNLEDWIALLVSLSRNRAPLLEKRPAVRSWAEKLDWHKVAPLYTDLYREALQSASPPGGVARR